MAALNRKRDEAKPIELYIFSNRQSEAGDRLNARDHLATTLSALKEEELLDPVSGRSRVFGQRKAKDDLGGLRVRPEVARALKLS